VVRRSLRERRSRGTLFQWPERFFFPEKSRKSRKFAEIRGFSAIFAEKVGFAWLFTEKNRKKSLFSTKNVVRSQKNTKKIDFLKNVPRASRDALCVEITQRASRDALCMGRSPRRSLRKTRYLIHSKQTKKHKWTRV